MRKPKFMVMAVLCVAMLAGCQSKEPVETKDVSYELTFRNDTGVDISTLCLRPAVDNYKWTANLLQEEVWKNGNDVPIELTGKIPVTDKGWEVKVTFANGEDKDAEHIWEGVQIADDAEISFTMKDAATLADDKPDEENDTKEDIEDEIEDIEDIDTEEVSTKVE